MKPVKHRNKMIWFCTLCFSKLNMHLPGRPRRRIPGPEGSPDSAKDSQRKSARTCLGLHAFLSLLELLQQKQGSECRSGGSENWEKTQQPICKDSQCEEQQKESLRNGTVSSAPRRGACTRESPSS